MFSRSEKILLGLMASIHFSHIVDFMIMMPLGPQLMRVFGISPRQFGLLVSSYTLAAGFSGLGCSLFLDRFDRKKSLLFFLTCFALGTIACAISRSYPLLLAARSFTGVFGGVLASIIFSAVGDAISAERRGTALGIVMGAFSAASIVGVPFSLYLANAFDWHAPFMFLGVLALLVSIVVSAQMHPMVGHLRGPHVHDQDPFFALKHILRSRTQVLALVFMFSLVFGQFSVIPFLSPSFVLNAGLPEADLPLIYLFGGLVAMFASPGFGRLSDRFGRKRSFYLGAVTSIPVFVIITNLGQTPRSILLVITSSFFLIISGRMVPAMAILTAATTPRFRGSFLSVVASVQQFSSAFASYFAGHLVTRASSGHLMGFSKVGWIAVFFSALAILLVRTVSVTDLPEPASA